MEQLWKTQALSARRGAGVTDSGRRRIYIPPIRSKTQRWDDRHTGPLRESEVTGGHGGGELARIRETKANKRSRRGAPCGGERRVESQPRLMACARDRRPWKMCGPPCRQRLQSHLPCETTRQVDGIGARHERAAGPARLALVAPVWRLPLRLMCDTASSRLSTTSTAQAVWSHSTLSDRAAGIFMVCVRNCTVMHTAISKSIRLGWPVPPSGPRGPAAASACDLHSQGSSR